MRFLVKNRKKFESDKDYLGFVEEISGFGESVGRNFCS